MEQKKYISIISHYESCLEKYGDTYLGVDWPKKEDVEIRYKIMLEVITHEINNKVSLLDFGCGASHLYEYICKNSITNIEYSGLDISEKFIQLSRSKFPSISYHCLDILNGDAELPDLIISL